MTRGVARRIALALTLAIVIAGVPARPAAAEPAEVAVRAADLWEATVEWLSSLWSPDPGPAGGGGAGAAAACKGDEGACVDPNG